MLLDEVYNSRAVEAVVPYTYASAPNLPEYALTNWQLILASETPW